MHVSVTISQAPVERHIWRFEYSISAVPKGKILRIELMTAAMVHWTMDDWKTINDWETKDTGIGLHIVDLTQTKKKGMIRFTLYWKDAGQWENKDFQVEIVHTST